MINLQKKTLKLLLEIQKDLKRFYLCNYPESVLAMESINHGRGTRGDGGESERERLQEKTCKSHICRHVVRVNSPASTLFCLFISFNILFAS